MHVRVYYHNECVWVYAHKWVSEQAIELQGISELALVSVKEKVMCCPRSINVSVLYYWKSSNCSLLNILTMFADNLPLFEIKSQNSCNLVVIHFRWGNGFVFYSQEPSDPRHKPYTTILYSRYVSFISNYKT